MAHPFSKLRITAWAVSLTVCTVAIAAPVTIDPNPTALMQAMQDRRVVLLGEVHDNAAQHELRVAALRQLIVNGARPAIAFEQFDREHQADIERARREQPRDVDYLITQANGNPGWHWAYYRPFIELAFQYDLPIVAANLSSEMASRVAIDGWQVLFDARSRKELRLNELPAEFRRKHEKAIASGHCNLLPRDALPAHARAQMARDIVVAQAIRPYLDRGVVLLAGNGHVRRDIGVPVWLPIDAARGALSIGMLERDDDGLAGESSERFDALVITERAVRADPCKGLEKQLQRSRQR